MTEPKAFPPGEGMGAAAPEEKEAARKGFRAAYGFN